MLPSFEVPMDPILDRTQDGLTVREAAQGWLHVQWTVTDMTLRRAASVMGRDGHRHAQVLRLHRVDQDDSGPRSKEHLSDVVVPDNVLEWFLNVPTLQHAWIIEIGFSYGKGKFFSLLHSTPVALSPHRPTHHDTGGALADSAFQEALEPGGPPPLKVNGTFVVSGSTRPRAQLVINDEAVPIDPTTGQFEWRRALQNGRAVFPITVSEYGRSQRGLLAVEVNLHLLDPEPVAEG